MKISDPKQLRRLHRLFFKKVGRPIIHWGYLVSPIVLGALLKMAPDTNWWWLCVVGAWTFAQIAREYWKENADKRRIQSDDFFDSYIEHLGEAMAIRGDVDSYTTSAVRLVQAQVLKTICAVVATYHHSEKSRDKFNASVMVPEACEIWIDDKTGNFKEAVHFFDVGRRPQACLSVLYLVCWAREPEMWKEFALPVDCDSDYLLPGAPRAFHNKQLQVLADTLDDKELDKQMPKHATEAKRQLRNYFETHEKNFRSFFSLPLLVNENVVGVLNVQSQETDILGINNEHGADLELCLRPFCALLAALIVREQETIAPHLDG